MPPRYFSKAEKPWEISYFRGNNAFEARARREVLVCGGAVNSPQLLQLSGIGPGGLLSKFGIATLVQSPNVGRNLQDHLGVDFHFRTNVPTLNQVFAPLVRSTQGRNAIFCVAAGTACAERESGRRFRPIRRKGRRTESPALFFPGQLYAFLGNQTQDDVPGPVSGNAYGIQQLQTRKHRDGGYRFGGSFRASVDTSELSGIG